MRQTENDQAEDTGKLDDVFETGLGECAHLI